MVNLRFFAGLLLACAPTPALALNIVIANDDGLTSNVKALYEALKAEGHDVIVSVPCRDQSGMGAALRFGVPLGALSADCRNMAARAGDPGVGPMTRGGLTADYHYVDGTPVMAMMYGVDVLAMHRWGRNPDLVLSGPNEGQNVGPVVISSGTVNNAMAAAFRGIPAIALSGAAETADNEGLANPASQRIAALAVKLVALLERNGTDGGLLPKGAALNVNFPADLSAPRWQASRVGDYSAYDIRFVERLTPRDPAGEHASAAAGLPGITASSNDTPPREEQMGDESVVYKTHISVSIVRVGDGGDASAREWLGAVVAGL